MSAKSLQCRHITAQVLKRIAAYAALCFFCIFALCCCHARKALPLPTNGADEEQDADNTGAAAMSASYKWYCFIDGDVLNIDLPRKAPPQMQKPWTEAVRVSAMCGADGDGTGTAPAYALVNHLGMVEMIAGQMRLHQDASIFSTRTAGPLAFSGNVPIFSVYRNTLFNNRAGQADVLHQFLVQFEPMTHIFYPIISCTNLALGDNAEVVDYVWDGQDFICSVKTISDVPGDLLITGGDAYDDASSNKQKTQFSYYRVHTTSDLTSITPQEKDAIKVESTTKEAYRKERMTASFNAAPKRLKGLLDFMTNQVSFIVSVATVGGKTPRGFVNDTGGALLNAYAIIGGTYVAAMFNDGTTYLAGNIPGVKKVNDTRAFRLPLLPPGWAYTSLAISGSFLYAAWEETDFYQTGRSGLISVDLAKVFEGAHS